MTKIKLAGADLSKGSLFGVDHIADDLYDDLSSRVFGVVELTPKSRTENAPDLDDSEDETSGHTVHLRLVSIELPTDNKTNNTLRHVLQAMRLRRTSKDTLTQEEDEQYSERIVNGALDAVSDM